MKNITYGYANERAWLITHAIRVDKESETLIMQLHMRSAYDSMCKQMTGISSH